MLQNSKEKKNLCPRTAHMYGHEPKDNQIIPLYNVNTLVSVVHGCPSFLCRRATVVIVGRFAGGACKVIVSVISNCLNCSLIVFA